MRVTLAVRSLSLIPVLAVVVAALACKDAVSLDEPVSPSEPPIVGVPPVTQPLAIQPPASLTLQVPRNVQLSTSRTDTAVVSWETNDQTVATVSASGLVSAIFPGSVTITARSGVRSATLILQITIARIDVMPSPALVSITGTQQLTAIVRDANGAELNGVPLSWRSDHPAIATVDATSGIVTGISSGNTPITVVGGGATGSTVVHVNLRVGAPLAFSSIGATANHACGIEAQTGFAYCWGDSHAGALGSDADGTFPALVSGGRRFTSISVGSYSTCAIEAESRAAYCWGSNGHGELGDGTQSTRWVPTLVNNGAIRFSSISAGGDVTCGIEAQTSLAYCWGKGGVIGDGTSSQRLIPTLVGGARLRFSSIGASDSHACGVEAQTSLLHCWGSNEFGQLGDGTTTARLMPTPVVGNRRFSSIDADYRMTCGIDAATALGYCWGHNPTGQVGDGTTMLRSVPTLVGDGSHRFSSINTGGQVSCAIEVDTNLGYCWGGNDLGQIGDGTTIARLAPTLVGDGRLRFSSISAALCCVTYAIEAQTGQVYGWGYGGLFPNSLRAPLFAMPTASSKQIRRVRS